MLLPPPARRWAPLPPCPSVSTDHHSNRPRCGCGGIAVGLGQRVPCGLNLGLFASQAATSNSGLPLLHINRRFEEGPDAARLYVFAPLKITSFLINIFINHVIRSRTKHSSSFRHHFLMIPADIPLSHISQQICSVINTQRVCSEVTSPGEKLLTAPVRHKHTATVKLLRKMEP